MTGGPVSRILCRHLATAVTVIPLARPLPAGSSATYPEVWRGGPPRATPCGELPPYLVLLRVGFAVPSASLRTRCALTAPFHPYCLSAAVCSLWHFPSTGFETGCPDVIRHTALRSSDFPPPALRSLAEASVRGAGGDHPAHPPTPLLYGGFRPLPGPSPERDLPDRWDVLPGRPVQPC